MPSSSKPTKRPQQQGLKPLVGLALGVALVGLLVFGLAFILLPKEQGRLREARGTPNPIAWPDYVVFDRHGAG